MGGKKNTLAFSNGNSINRNYWNGGFICHFDLLCCYKQNIKYFQSSNYAYTINKMNLSAFFKYNK